MIYVYAIAESMEQPPKGPGLDGAAPLLLEREGLTAIYSLHAELDSSLDPRSLWRHEAVVEEAMRAGAVLPARFATTFPDLDDLAAVLVREGPRLREALKRVRGCVELAVRVTLPSAPPVEQRDGHAYLRERREAVRVRESAMQRLKPLDELAVATTHTAALADSAPLRASYLVRRDDVARFAEEMTRLEREEDQLVFSCTGPWAPYSFVGEETS